MKKLLLALALFFAPSLAIAQCNGVVPNNYACGNVSGGSGILQPIPFASFPTVPGGTPGQIQYNNSGVLSGFTASGDCTVNPSIGVFVCTKTNAVAFAPSATTDTTNAANIVSGILAAARLPAGVPAFVLRQATTNDNIQTTDCNKLVQEGTGSSGKFTITLPAASGFSANCTIYIQNGDTSTLSGKILSGFPSGCISTKFFLFPGVVIGLTNVNNTWVYSYCPAQYVPTAAMTLSVNSGGSDSTGDGFTNPFATVQRCITIFEQAVFYPSDLAQPTCQLTSNIVESAVHYFPVPGTNTLNILSNTCTNTWKPSGANIFSLAVGNGGNVQLSCINISGTSTTCNAAAAGPSACTLLIAHNNNVVLETLASVTITDAGTNGFGIVTDTNTAGGAEINIDNGLKIAGTASSIMRITGRASVLWNSVLDGTATPTVTQLFLIQGASVLCIQGNFSATGSFPGTRQFAVLNGAQLWNISGIAIPGSAGITTAAGFTAGAATTTGAAGC